MFFRGLMLSGYLPRDPGAFCYEGYLVSQGWMPYRDFWEHKNPGMALLLGGVFAVFGASVLVARLAEAVLIAAAADCLIRIERRLFAEKATGVSGLIYSMLSSIPQLTDGGLYTGFWSAAFQVFAVSAMLAAIDARARWRMAIAVLAGFFFFCAFSCRQTGLAGLALLLPILVRTSRPIAVRVLTGVLLTFSALALLSVAWLFVTAAWPRFIQDTIEFNVAKNAWLAQVDPRRTRIWSMLRGWTAILWLPASLALVGLAVTFANRQTRATALLIAAWLGLGLLASVTSRAGYWHYVLELVPPLALATAAAVSQCGVRSWPRLLRMALPVLVSAAVLASPRWSDYDLAYLRHGWDWCRGSVARDGSENLLHAAAARLDSLAETNERVHVWSALPTIHFLSRTLPATRYAQNLPLLDEAASDAAEIERVLEDLKRQPPRFCVIVFEDLREFASRTDALPPSHQAWLNANYVSLKPSLGPPTNPRGRYNHVKIEFFERILR